MIENNSSPTPFGTGVQRFTAPHQRLLSLVNRQAIYAIVGLALMLVVARIDYTRFRELRLGLYAGAVGLILLVLAAGGATRGSRRWLELPFFRFQPSELGKVLLVLALSAFLIDRVRSLSDREVTSRMMLFAAGTRWTHFAALGGLAVAAATIVLIVAPAVGTPVLKDYQKERLTAFL